MKLDRCFETERTPLLICVTLGIGIGSVFAGLISAGKIELGARSLGRVGDRRLLHGDHFCTRLLYARFSERLEIGISRRVARRNRVERRLF